MKMKNDKDYEERLTLINELYENLNTDGQIMAYISVRNIFECGRYPKGSKVINLNIRKLLDD